MSKCLLYIESKQHCQWISYILISEMDCPIWTELCSNVLRMVLYQIFKLFTDRTKCVLIGWNFVSFVNQLKCYIVVLYWRHHLVVPYIVNCLSHDIGQTIGNWKLGNCNLTFFGKLIDAKEVLQLKSSERQDLSVHMKLSSIN